MDLMFTLQIILVILAATSALIAISRPKKWMTRASGLVVFVAIVGTSFFAFVELLGRPKPIDFASVGNATEAATVISSYYREEEAIYLWIRGNDEPEPRAYVLPWDIEAAKDLQKAKAKAEAQGTEVTVRKGKKSKNSGRGEWEFSTTDHKTLPAKT